MASRTPGWVKWVGLLLLALFLIGAGLAVGGFFAVRSSVREFQAADRSFDSLAVELGDITRYRPQPGGRIAADRIEAFLAARDSIAARREKTERALSLLGDDGSGRAWSKLRGSFSLARNLAPFHRERNEALMESQIGLGEYYYLYVLAYYSWLGKSPADGPPFKLVGASGYLLDTLEPMERSAVISYREEQARRSLNRLLLPVLRHQLEDLPEPDASGSFGELLAGEIAALEADPDRMPWQDGLPEALVQSLAPYRERLEASYSSTCNAIEIGLARRSPNLDAPRPPEPPDA